MERHGDAARTAERERLLIELRMAGAHVAVAKATSMDRYIEGLMALGLVAERYVRTWEDDD